MYLAGCLSNVGQAAAGWVVCLRSVRWFYPVGWASVVLAACVLVGLWGVGCDRVTQSAEPAAEYNHVYTVRARVTQLPDGSPGGGFYAHHERIPDYVSVNGSIGMDSMIMPFTIVDDSVLDGLSVGDVVEITYGESFRPAVKQGVIAVTELPADTVLSFEEASP